MELAPAMCSSLLQQASSLSARLRRAFHTANSGASQATCGVTRVAARPPWHSLHGLTRVTLRLLSCCRARFSLRLNRGGSQAQARADCANRCSQATPHPGITGALCRFKSGRRKRPSAFDAVWPSATTSCLGWCKIMPGSTRPLQPLPESRPLRVPRAL